MRDGRNMVHTVGKRFSVGNVLVALWMNQQYDDYNEINDKAISNRTYNVQLLLDQESGIFFLVFQLKKTTAKQYIILLKIHFFSFFTYYIK